MTSGEQDGGYSYITGFWTAGRLASDASPAESCPRTTGRTRLTGETVEEPRSESAKACNSDNKKEARRVGQ